MNCQVRASSITLQSGGADLVTLQDDLTSVDLEASAPGIVPSSSSGTTVSLYPYISLSGSHATNIQNPDSLQRILRPLDSREVVMSNDEVDELDDGGHDGGIWRGGAIDSQDDDDEILVHVKCEILPRTLSTRPLTSALALLQSVSSYGSSTSRLPATLPLSLAQSFTHHLPRHPAPCRSLLISTGGGRSSSSPRLAKIYVNRGPAGVSFSDDPAGGLKADQEMELLEVADAQKPSVEYPVRAARFANVSELDLYFVRRPSRRALPLRSGSAFPPCRLPTSPPLHEH